MTLYDTYIKQKNEKDRAIIISMAMFGAFATTMFFIGPTFFRYLENRSIGILLDVIGLFAIAFLIVFSIERYYTKKYGTITSQAPIIVEGRKTCTDEYALFENEICLKLE